MGRPSEFHGSLISFALSPALCCLYRPPKKLKLKPKTQGKNSTSGRHFPSFNGNSRKKTHFSPEKSKNSMKGLTPSVS